MMKKEEEEGCYVGYVSGSCDPAEESHMHIDDVSMAVARLQPWRRYGPIGRLTLPRKATKYRAEEGASCFDEIASMRKVSLPYNHPNSCLVPNSQKIYMLRSASARDTAR